MAGNFAAVTERSFGVPDGVNTGQFGVGIVIDFFGFSSQASGFPVDFVYPTVTALVPANIGVVNNAPNEAGAVSLHRIPAVAEGQHILFDPEIQRLPVNPATYAKAPEGLPNPFEDSSIGAAVKFDVNISGERYNVVNSLFDVMITYRLNDLRDAVRGDPAGRGEARRRRQRRSGGPDRRGPRADRSRADHRSPEPGSGLRRRLHQASPRGHRRGRPASGRDRAGVGHDDRRQLRQGARTGREGRRL